MSKAKPRKEHSNSTAIAAAIKHNFPAVIRTFEKELGRLELETSMTDLHKLRNKLGEF